MLEGQARRRDDPSHFFSSPTEGSDLDEVELPAISTPPRRGASGRGGNFRGRTGSPPRAPRSGLRLGPVMMRCKGSVVDGEDPLTSQSGWTDEKLPGRGVSALGGGKEADRRRSSPLVDCASGRTLIHESKGEERSGPASGRCPTYRPAAPSWSGRRVAGVGPRAEGRRRDDFPSQSKTAAAISAVRRDQVTDKSFTGLRLPTEMVATLPIHGHDGSAPLVAGRSGRGRSHPWSFVPLFGRQDDRVSGGRVEDGRHSRIPPRPRPSSTLL